MSDNKIVLITGGSRGLGKNAALKIADKGMDVILTYHSNKDKAEEVVKAIESKGRKAVSLQLDVADTKGFDSFVEDVKLALSGTFKKEKIDFLINNAGIGLHTDITNTDESDIDQLVNIHFKSPIILTQKLLPLMNDGGGIVNVSSGLARFAMPGYSVYGSLKAAMESYSRYQAKELGARGIRSNIIAPGAIETDFGGGTVRDNEQVNQMVASVTALGRVGVPDDIGSVMAFLCTDDARWISGQRIEVSGGMVL